MGGIMTRKPFQPYYNAGGREWSQLAQASGGSIYYLGISAEKNIRGVSSNKSKKVDRSVLETVIPANTGSSPYLGWVKKA